MTTVIRTYERQKLINAILYFATNTNKCGVTKLIKLLCLLDFEHFRQTSKSVTGATYSAWDLGPVPEPLWHEFDKAMQPDLAAAVTLREYDKFKKVVIKRVYDPQFHTPRERAIMAQLAKRYYNHTARQMVEVTHQPGSPWSVTTREKGQNQAIDYRLALDARPDSLTQEEVHYRTRERDEMYDAFGVRR
jgi:uncharacterized phage-associated protein